MSYFLIGESTKFVSYAVWTVHCLNREKFENGEKTTRNLYAYQRGKTALHVPEHSLGGSQQVHTEKISKVSKNGESTKNDKQVNTRRQNSTTDTSQVCITQ